MAQYFNFRRLIEKYSKDFYAEIPSEGYFNDVGDWEIGDPQRVNLRGAIISHRELKIFRSEGTLTGQDRALYMLEPLENALQLAKIYADNNIYTVGDALNNAEFTGVWGYTLKFVSAFKKEAADYDITKELDQLGDRLDGILTKPSETEPKPTITEHLDKLEQRLDGKLL